MGTSYLFLVLCFSLPEFAFTNASTAYRNANGESKVPWASPIQTYQMRIGECSCSVFMVSPTVGITAAHCFDEILLKLTSPEVVSSTTTPKLVQTHFPGVLYGADSLTEISRIESAFVTSLYFDSLRKVSGDFPNMYQNRQGDFAFIRINPKIEIHEEVLFASDKQWPFTAQAVAAGCRCLNDGNLTPRCCIMQLTYMSESDEAFIGRISPSIISSKPEDCNDDTGGYSGGPVTISDENGKKYVVGIHVANNLDFAGAIRLDRYVPLIKDLIAADEPTAADQSRGDRRPITGRKRFAKWRLAGYRNNFVEIEFQPPSTAAIPQHPNYRIDRILHGQLPVRRSTDGFQPPSTAIPQHPNYWIDRILHGQLPVRRNTDGFQPPSTAIPQHPNYWIDRILHGQLPVRRNTDG